MDGARLGYGLAADESDMTLADIAKYTDVFYIGGTKVGALCGEAVVFTKNNCPPHFFTHIKQSGALLAKGRLNAIQFDTLFTDGLYLKISRHAIECAKRLKEILAEKNYEFFIDAPTNQVFIIVENERLKQLGEEIRYSFWEKYDENRTVIRLATSWATDISDVEALKDIL
jgi:threonine aldolase